MRVVVVDDEPIAARRLELQLRRIVGVELVGSASSGEEALALVNDRKPDVLLVDVQMGGISGFEVVDALTPPNVPLVIFITAFDHFAAKAFDLRAVDYVLKPVKLERLQAALAQARSVMDAATAANRIAELREVVVALREIAHVTQASSGPSFEKEFWAESRGELLPVRVDDIEWVEAERDYVRLHVNQTSFLFRESMIGMLSRLDPTHFVRVRRSALVRWEGVTAIRHPAYGDYRVQMKGGDEIRVGRTYLKHLRRLMAKN